MLMAACLNKMRLQPEHLARTMVKSALEAMASSNKHAHNIFPRLIELIKYRGVPEIMSEKLRDVPAWMMIKWVSQVLAIMHEP